MGFSLGWGSQPLAVAGPRCQAGAKRSGVAMRLEVCVDDAEGLAEAVAGGADRIELCAALAVGGLTPTPGLTLAAAASPIPVYPMIRPRPGSFTFTAAEVATMRADIRFAREAGLPGVVLGASLPDGRLDETVLSDLVAEARGLDLTLHRCIDLAPDVDEAIESAVALGFRRILSSGGAPKAHLGLPRLARMIATAAGRLSIMPGSGVSPDTWPLLAALPITEVHASCAAPLPGQADAFGFVTGQEKRTSRAAVRALKDLLSA